MTVVAFARAFRVAEGKFPMHSRYSAPMTGFGQIVAERVPLRKLDPAAWDRFAAECDASFESSYDHMRAEALKDLGRHRYHCFELWLTSGISRTKIGQCAVSAGAGRFTIRDRIQLLPAYAAEWPRALSALLRHLGPGRYRYGGLLSCEPSREAELRAHPGVTVDYARPFAVQGVAFGQWPNWDRYWAKVSDSVRYEAKYAPERVAGLRLERFQGLAMLRALPSMVAMQGASLGRKKLNFGIVRQTLRHAYYMALCSRSLEVVLAKADAGVLAAFYGGRMGGNTYYIYGGQRAGSGGANWYLLKEMTRHAYEAAPGGRFVMGNVDYAVHDEKVGGGLLRARRALRVTDHETAMIDFRYSTARPQAAAPAVHHPVAFSRSFALAA